MRDELFDLVLEHDELADLDPARRRLAIRDLVARSTSDADVGRLVTEIADAVDGHGPLSVLWDQPEITDILVNGAGEVWVERDGVLEPAGVRFHGEEELRRLVERMLAQGGARADASKPIADARLPDGSRVHVVLPPLAPGGPLVSIRRHPLSPLRLEDLEERRMFGHATAALLRGLVHDRSTIAIIGGTGTGKTTLLNALLSEVADTERVVVVEETPELRPACRHWVSLVARSPNVEGLGGVELSDLVRAALRMRPDRIVVGEIRGAEAFAALTAMTVGHEGSMVTLHARSPREALDRFATLASEGRSPLSEERLRTDVQRTLDAVVHVDRAEGRRIVRHVELL